MSNGDAATASSTIGDDGTAGTDADEKVPGSVGAVRCELDPSLKAPCFQKLTLKKDNSAFNLYPGF